MAQMDCGVRSLFVWFTVANLLQSHIFVVKLINRDSFRRWYNLSVFKSHCNVYGRTPGSCFLASYLRETVGATTGHRQQGSTLTLIQSVLEAVQYFSNVVVGQMCCEDS